MNHVILDCLVAGTASSFEDAGLDDEHVEALAGILRATELAWTVVTHDKAFLAAIEAEVWSLEGSRLHPR